VILKKGAVSSLLRSSGTPGRSRISGAGYRSGRRKRFRRWKGPRNRARFIRSGPCKI